MCFVSWYFHACFICIELCLYIYTHINQELTYSYNLIFSFGDFFGVEAELNGTQKLVFGIIITDPEH